MIVINRFHVSLEDGEDAWKENHWAFTPEGPDVTNKFSFQWEISAAA